jgi:hypothetical protein
MFTNVLLGFGVVLALGQTAIAGPALPRAPRVVDINGRILGSLGSDGVNPAANVLRREGSKLVVFRVTRLEISIEPVYLLHVRPDCSGPAYLAAPDQLVPRSTMAFDPYKGLATTAYYPGDPIQTLTIGSQQYVNPPAGCIANGHTPLGADRCCEALTPIGRVVGPAQHFDVSIYTPPFSIK